MLEPELLLLPLPPEPPPPRSFDAVPAAAAIVWLRAEPPALTTEPALGSDADPDPEAEGAAADDEPDEPLVGALWAAVDDPDGEDAVDVEWVPQPPDEDPPPRRSR